jgi:hypothetical protein
MHRPERGINLKMGGCIYYHHYKHKLKILLRFFSKKNGGTNKKLKSFFNENIKKNA